MNLDRLGGDVISTNGGVPGVLPMVLRSEIAVLFA